MSICAIWWSYQSVKNVTIKVISGTHSHSLTRCVCDMTYSSCNTGSSVVKLSPKCFVEPYNYTQQVITEDMLQQFKSYLREEAAHTNLNVKVKRSLSIT